jgi:uncharacterized protein (DUF2141 family)
MIRNISRCGFLVFGAFVLVASCAKISSPSGGPRDKKPPVVLKSLPVNGTRNFTGDKLSVTFDEYVVLDKITEKFMVSPPMAKKPRVYTRNKSVIVEYDEKLRDSTTYTFYFQDAVRDLNEANILENFQIVFSTGPDIDSLSVTGNVLNALSLDPPEGVMVMLYSNPNDSAFKKTIPDYISRADKNGYFRLDNVKAGTYRLYALKDADNSRSFNLADEDIAFMDSTLTITPETNYLPFIPDTTRTKKTSASTPDTVILKGEYKLILFKPEKKLHYLSSSSRSAQYKLNYTLSLPPDSMAFDFTIPGADPRSYIIERNREKDSLQVWLIDSLLFSQSPVTTILNYPFTDTTGVIAQKEDTLLMRFVVPRAPRGKTKTPAFKVSSSFAFGSLRPGQQIVLSSMTPFREPDTSRIKIYELSGEEKMRVPFSISPDSSNICRMFLNASFFQGKNYLYIADSASFSDIFGARSDSTGNRFLVRADNTFGKIVLNIKNYQGNRIVQLLSGEKIVKEIYMNSDGKTEFTYLNPGKYTARIIGDINGDKKWTTGDFETGRQPEPVFYMPKEIDVKEFWEFVEDWDAGEKNVKKVKKTAQKNMGRTNN